jgi:hypothetical protein
VTLGSSGNGREISILLGAGMLVDDFAVEENGLVTGRDGKGETGLREGREGVVLNFDWTKTTAMKTKIQENVGAE